MVWLILGIVGSVLFGIERYRYCKGNNATGRTKIIFKSIGAGLGMLAVISLILAIALGYWI